MVFLDMRIRLICCNRSVETTDKGWRQFSKVGRGSNVLLVQLRMEGRAAVQGSSQFVGLKTGCWSFGDALRFPQVGKIPNFPSRELRRSFSEHKSEL